MHNVIKRTTTIIIYKQLVDTTAGAAGDLFKAYKDGNNWHCKNITTGENTIYLQFISNLRNENLTKIITQY